MIWVSQVWVKCFWIWSKTTNESINQSWKRFKILNEDKKYVQVWSPLELIKWFKKREWCFKVSIQICVNKIAIGTQLIWTALYLGFLRFLTRALSQLDGRRFRATGSKAPDVGQTTNWYNIQTGCQSLLIWQHLFLSSCQVNLYLSYKQDQGTRQVSPSLLFFVTFMVLY